jgi:hypothetical protein
MLTRPVFWLISMFMIATLPNLMEGEAIYWEAANAFGFIAFSGILVLMANGYSKSGYSHFHRWFGIVIFVSMLIHALWFLIEDATVLEYLLPGAPVYMVLGISALLISVLITASSFKRPAKVSYVNARTFRYWHNWQAILILVLSALHIAMSGFYFRATWQWVLITALSILCFVLPAPTISAKKGERRQSLISLTLLSLASFIAIIAFIFLRSSFLWAG